MGCQNGGGKATPRWWTLFAGYKNGITTGTAARGYGRNYAMTTANG
jgi:hypothetical protein